MNVTMLWRDWFSDGTVASCGLSAEIVIAALYLMAAAQPSPRGRRWPRHRTAAFLAGLVVIVLALDSGIAARDEVPVVHATQHVLLMMLAPALLALGRPVTLIMRGLGPTGRRRFRALLHEPSVRSSTARPWLLVLDYAATMTVAMLGPVQRLADHHLAVHVAIHVYLIVCGAIFWTVVLARDPVPNRQPARIRLAMVSAAVPLAGVQAVSVVLVPGLYGVRSGAPALGVALIVLGGTTLTSLSGALAIRRTVTARRRWSEPAPSRPAAPSREIRVTLLR